MTSLGFLEGFFKGGIQNGSFDFHPIDQLLDFDFSKILSDREKFEEIIRNGNNLNFPDKFDENNNYKSVKSKLKIAKKSFDFMHNVNRNNNLINDYFSNSIINFSDLKPLNKIDKDFPLNENFKSNLIDTKRELYKFSLHYSDIFSENMILKINIGFNRKKESKILEEHLKEKYKINTSSISNNLQNFQIEELVNLFFEELKIGEKNSNLFYYEYDKVPKVIDESFFLSNESFFTYNLKRLLDFIKCHIFYEDIPIYKQKYSNLIQNIKIYLFEFYFRKNSYDLFKFVYYYAIIEILNPFLEFYKNVNENKEIEDFNKFLLIFHHHKGQNSLLSLIIPFENFFKIFNNTLQKGDEFLIIANSFCGVLRMELFENSKKVKNFHMFNRNYLGFKIYYEDIDLSDYIDENLIGRVDVFCGSDLIKRESYLDMEKFKNYLIELDKDFKSFILTYSIENINTLFV